MALLVRVSGTVAIALLLFAAGCSPELPLHQLPEIPGTPISPAPASPPTVGFELRVNVNGEMRTATAGDNTALLEVLQTSGEFSSVNETPNTPDLSLHLNLEIAEDDSYVLPLLVSTLTLGMIPASYTYRYILACEASRSDGRKRDYRLEDSVRSTVWLPNLFVTWDDAEDPFMRNMYRNLLVRLREDGMLSDR